MIRLRQCISRRLTSLLVLISMLCACVLSRPVCAQVLVTPTVSPASGGLYHYNYSVTNNESLDLIIVTTTVLNQPDAVQNLTAPTGFNAFFDPTLGLMDFVEDTDAFTVGTTVSGFQFDSSYAPSLSSFQALALDGSGNIVTYSGVALAPAAVPEPGALVLVIAAAPCLLFGCRRRAG